MINKNGRVGVSCQGRLRPIEHIVTAPYPGFPTDVQPLLMAALLRADGESRFTENIFEARYRHVPALRKLGADIRVDGREALVRGTSRLHGAAVEATDLALLEDVYRRYYGNVPEMKVVLCSDLPKEEIRPLVERYLASLALPYPYTKGRYLPSKPVVKGKHTIEEDHVPVSAPFTEISYNWYYKGGRTPRERAAVDVLNYILSARYLALIREERGGAYSVQFCTATSNEAAVPTRSYVDFQTRPEMRYLLLSDVQEELARMCADGPTPEEMDLAVRYLVKHHDEQEDRIARSVSLQEDRMVEFVRWGTPYGYDYEKLVRSLKSSDIRAFARRVSGGDKIVKVYNEE